jgi:hypothetical protein
MINGQSEYLALTGQNTVVHRNYAPGFPFFGTQAGTVIIWQVKRAPTPKKQLKNIGPARFY